MSLADKFPHRITLVIRGKYNKYYVCRTCDESFPTKATMEAHHTILPIITETIYK